ncbi:uncharacterized protein [Gossypium hirsutum]|uniref:RNase H type-1 domain-containing protein n=1 Tax=Gossypium hirsutum TaxID=3635 RepID=A0A1U8I4G6_GOSHI|nr:uncharacterized protein LOC107892549 [Gossypium hirsutum]
MQDVLDAGLAWARDYDTSRSLVLQLSPMVTMSRWSPLESRWFKLNTDGAISLTNQQAAIGVVFRDADANWICDFSMRMGKDNIFKVEGRAVLEGSHVAWGRGLRQVEVECDNALLVESLLVGGYVNSKMVKLRLIRGILNREWKVRIRHVPRSHGC